MSCKRTAERPCDGVTGPFFAAVSVEESYVKQTGAFAWERTSVADLPYYPIYLGGIEKSRVELLKTLWKLWITFCICMAMQSYGNCIMRRRPPETLANPRAAPPGEEPPGREAGRAIRSV